MNAYKVFLHIKNPVQMIDLYLVGLLFESCLVRKYAEADDGIDCLYFTS